MLLTGVLCATVAGSGPAAANDGADPSPGAATESPGMTMDEIAKKYPGFVKPDGKSWNEVIGDLSEPMTEDEVAAVIERTKQSSSVAHYYPDAPDDGRMEPPPLNAAGEEE
ncbi:hypothetical protein [Actinoplanes sp. GCM10030250]|uniref:hypothetical protein n=1 Tax=Actinoplanes sp. GCM10030250 TaxID=3273376 RepID=UPI00361C1CC7